MKKCWRVARKTFLSMRRWRTAAAPWCSRMQFHRHTWTSFHSFVRWCGGTLFCFVRHCAVSHLVVLFQGEGGSGPSFFQILNDQCRKLAPTTAGAATLLQALRNQLAAHPNVSFGVHPDTFTVSFPVSGQRLQLTASQLFLRNFESTPSDIAALMRYNLCFFLFYEVIRFDRMLTLLSGSESSSPVVKATFADAASRHLRYSASSALRRLVANAARRSQGSSASVGGAAAVGSSTAAQVEPERTYSLSSSRWKVRVTSRKTARLTHTASR